MSDETMTAEQLALDIMHMDLESVIDGKNPYVRLCEAITQATAQQAAEYKALVEAGNTLTANYEAVKQDCYALAERVAALELDRERFIEAAKECFGEDNIHVNRTLKEAIGNPTSSPSGVIAVLKDGLRYQRLRVLGVAPCGSQQLQEGTVLCAQNLDAYIDADMKAHPSRGEAQTLAPEIRAAVEGGA